MVRRYRTEGEERYLRGFFAAIEKGRAAADEPSFGERDNPYRSFEHRTNWLLGFRKRRAELTKDQAHD